MKRKFLLFSPLILFLIACGVAYFFIHKNVQNKQQAAALKSQYQQTRHAVQGGESLDAAVEDATQLVALARAAGVQSNVAESNILLARALFSRNQKDDRQNAATLLKSVIADPSTSGIQAVSGAYALFAEWFYLTQDSALMKSLVFNTPPLDKYLAQAKGSVSDATILLYKQSSALYPRSATYYEMAAQQAFILAEQKVDSKSEKQKEIVTSINQNILAGDTLMQSAPPAETLNMVVMYLARSRALLITSRYSKNISNALVYESFDKTIEAADKDSNNNSTVFYGLVARLEYANTLYARENGAQNAKIKKLLQAVSESKSSRLDSFLIALKANAKDQPASNLLLQATLRLAHANISPEFSAYLKQLGWSW